MKHYNSMSNDQADKKKNLEAGAYTAVILTALGLLLFLVSWQLPEPVKPDPPLELQGIEVNLGTDETGLGTDQPILPGDPAPDVAKSAASVPGEGAPDNSADDPDSDVSNPKNETKTNTKPAETPRIKNPSTRPVENNAPRLKNGAQMGKTSPNFNGPGGNGAVDGYHKGGSEGITSGNDDQGKVGGNPNSKNYNGITISRGLGGRSIQGKYSFSDDFDRDATVMVDVTVDASGRVTHAVTNPKGTTTTNAKTKKIAERKALEIKFTSGSAEQTGTLKFVFKVNG